VKQAIFHKFVDVVITYWNNDLLPGRAFGGYLDTWFRLRRARDDFMDLINLLSV